MCKYFCRWVILGKLLQKKFSCNWASLQLRYQNCVRTHCVDNLYHIHDLLFSYWGYGKFFIEEHGLRNCLHYLAFLRGETPTEVNLNMLLWFLITLWFNYINQYLGNACVVTNINDIFHFINFYMQFQLLNWVAILHYGILKSLSWEQIYLCTANYSHLPLT